MKAIDVFRNSGELPLGPSESSTARALRPREGPGRWQRLAIFSLMAGYFLLLTGISAANYLGPDRWVIPGILQYAPSWIWALPAALLIPLVAWISRRLLWAPLLMLLWAAGPLMGFCLPLARASAPSGAARVRVMTYNIQWGRDGWGHIAREVANAQPDVLLLQDARDGAQGPLKEILAGWGTHRYGQFLIASRLPVLDTGVGDVSYRGERHTYFRARIQTGATVTTFCSVHLATPRAGLQSLRSGDGSGVSDFARGVEDRIEQVRAIIKDVIKIGGPAVVGGDLNATASSLVCRALDGAGFKNAHSSAGLGYGYTFGHKTRLAHSFVRIDHIYYTRHWQPIRCFTGGGQGSDHRPVIVDLIPSAGG